MKLGFFTFIVSGLMLLGSSSSFAFVDSQYSQKEKLPCGLKGTIEDRIRDCSSQESSRRGVFILVTRTDEFKKEVYKDSTSGFLWGDRLPSVMSYYDAEEACKASLEEVGRISEVTWRLPSIEEYRKANFNGITAHLPNMRHAFWSSSLHPSYSDVAWLFYGYDGYTDSFGDRNYNDYVSVRCVAR